LKDAAKNEKRTSMGAYSCWCREPESNRHAVSSAGF
jgi:hypothetical protein